MDETTGKILLVSGIAAVLIIAFFAYGLSPQLNINEDWWIIYAGTDQTSGKELHNKYGALLVSIETAEGKLNTPKQSLLFIGGNPTFRERMPWFESGEYLSVIRPDAQPNVYWNGTHSNYYIQTPHGKYYTMKNGALQHDYGVVTKGYDKTLQRWIIICTGWTQECTYAGAKLLIEDFSLIEQYDWIVYECTGKSEAAPSTWMLSQFQYTIVANG